MNNEPVAWVIDVKMTDCDDNFIWNTGNYPDWQVKHWIPLYTHPVNPKYDPETGEPLIDGYPLFSGLPHPVKELTKNIAGVWRMSDQSIQIVFTSCRSASEFEAILRKAQEK